MASLPFPAVAPVLSALMPAVDQHHALVEWCNNATVDEGGSSDTTLLSQLVGAAVNACVRAGGSAPDAGAMDAESVAHACSLLRSDVEYENVLRPVVSIAEDLYTQPYLNKVARANALAILRGVMMAEAAVSMHGDKLTAMMEPAAPSLCAYLQQRIVAMLYGTASQGSSGDHGDADTMATIAVLQAGLVACPSLPAFGKAAWAVLEVAAKQLQGAATGCGADTSARIAGVRALYTTSMLAEHILCVVPDAPTAATTLEAMMNAVLSCDCSTPEGASVLEGSDLRGLQTVGGGVNKGVTWTTWSQLLQAATSWQYASIAAIAAAAETLTRTAGVDGASLFSLPCRRRVVDAISTAMRTCTHTLSAPLLVALRFVLSLPGVVTAPGTAHGDDGIELDLEELLDNAWSTVMDVRPHRPVSMQCMCDVFTHPAFFKV